MAQEARHPSSGLPLSNEKMSVDHKSLWSLKRWFGRDDVANPCPPIPRDGQRPGVVRRLSRKVVPGLPRPGTFRRQQSELRDNLEPIKPKPAERRTVSMDRKGYSQARDLSRSGASTLPRTSAPVLMKTPEYLLFPAGIKGDTINTQINGHIDVVGGFDQIVDGAPADSESFLDHRSLSDDGFDDDLLEELEKRWILNLSMHFRDKSSREKFFVTFAETSNHWRRVTISLDYRDAPEGSLEEELQHMKFQRDKSARIYESIRDSLPDIQFYETVTNLKLQTERERLHVHVTEDIHEVISYPSVTAINHLHCRRIRESDLVFDSHLSGFVYKVKHNEEIFIKKEIPGPDTVEEFLYEINALHRLSGSDSVIQFGGVIVDNEEKLLKGLLISYAEKGALIDVIFDNKGNLSWERRERWARQIVRGLSEIHEAGFVQGDFTLSNIVIDADDRAKIIDINRRGCPVGWEPPEVAALIESKQRISMYIGVKSDIFQLGMVLWAIAMEQDEPEIQPRPLTLGNSMGEIPTYYRALVGICLSDDPASRRHTTSLLGMFPDVEQDGVWPYCDRAHTPDHVETQHIDPATAVGIDDIDNFRVLSLEFGEATGNPRSVATHTYVSPPTDISGEPYCYPTRGRSPPARSFHDMDSESATSNYHGRILEEPMIRGSSVNNSESRMIIVSPRRNPPLDAAKRVPSPDAIEAVKHEFLREPDPSKYSPNLKPMETTQHEPAPEIIDVVKHDMGKEPFEAIECGMAIESIRGAKHDSTSQTIETIKNGTAQHTEQIRHYRAPDPTEAVQENLIQETAEAAAPVPIEEPTYAAMHDAEPDLVAAARRDSTSSLDNAAEHESARAIGEEARHDVTNGPREPAHPDSILTAQHPLEVIGDDSASEYVDDIISGYSGRLWLSEPVIEKIPEDLAGIGQHSTFEQRDFPQGVLDDDLTTDML